MAKRVVKEPDVIDVGATSDDQQMIQVDGDLVSRFMGGVVQFLSTARQLEAKAGALEKTAQAFALPANASEDAHLQRFVQTARATSQEIAKHWEITSVFYRFHKRLVALRERGAARAEKAGGVAQRLHNRYVEQEQRRVEEENRRREQQALAEAEDRRRADLDRLEREALNAEAASEDLSARERVFVAAMVAGREAESAAREAGYRDPSYAGARLLGRTKIQRAMFAAKEAIAIRQQAMAKAAAPLVPDVVEEVAPAIDKVGTDRTTWKAEIVDARLFVEAVIGGKHGIPAACLEPNQKTLTEYARSMHELINRWPGVRAVKTTTTV